jgi:hypothetical protein
MAPPESEGIRFWIAPIRDQNSASWKLLINSVIFAWPGSADSIRQTLQFEEHQEPRLAPLCLLPKRLFPCPHCRLLGAIGRRLGLRQVLALEPLGMRVRENRWSGGCISRGSDGFAGARSPSRVEGSALREAAARSLKRSDVAANAIAA